MTVAYNILIFSHFTNEYWVSLHPHYPLIKAEARQNIKDGVNANMCYYLLQSQVLVIIIFSR